MQKVVLLQRALIYLITMPLIEHRTLATEGEIGLWRITESEAWFRQQLSLKSEEEEQLAQIKGFRRLEWLAARQLVHEMSGREHRGMFIKDEFGKPHLEDADWYISISHSNHLSAAIAGPNPVGIDIQKLVGKITRIIPRFMSDREQSSLAEATIIPHAHVYWGAKEALYKAYGRKELDLCRHIKVEPFAWQDPKGQSQALVAKGDYYQEFVIHYELRDTDFMLVWCEEVS